MALDIPLDPPLEWFSPPAGGIPTDRRVVIEPNGRTYGYVALYGQCHVGHEGCVQPPKGSPTNYDFAHQGETVTAAGEVIRTAVVAGGAGHAPADMDTAMVPRYYESMGDQLMRVRYGEDEHGLWFAGALWPDVDEIKVAKLRASSLSGDWRWHAAWRQTRGGFDLMGACLVNIPGFSVDRGQNSERPGRPMALAASGTKYTENVNYVHFDGESFRIVNTPLTAAGDTEMSDCTGNPEDCGCGGNCPEASATPEALIDQMRDLVSRHDALQAAAAAESDPIAKLDEKIDVLHSAVYQLVAERISDELTSDFE